MKFCRKFHSTEMYYLACGCLLAAAPVTALAADYTTFESFYRQSWSWPWALAGLAAVIAAAGVFYIAIPAGAAATSVGTWIGGLFGYSGAAATNFGLALLGGGSVASGGAGVAGGAALLVAALSFSTDVVIDYTTNKAIEGYQYRKFVAASQQMTTLPLPRNKKGASPYTAGMDELEAIDELQPLSSGTNQAVILKAKNAVTAAIQDEKALIEELADELEMSAEERAGVEVFDTEDMARLESLIALLDFVSNNYIDARTHASAAIRAANAARIKCTLPEFVLATSMLYDKKVDFETAVSALRYAIHSEPTNPMTPLLFGVFLDRMMYRINEGALPAVAVKRVAEVAELRGLDKQWVPVQAVVLSRYLILLKLEQQRIASLTATSNKKIRDSEKTLLTVRQSLEDYEGLLQGAQFVAGALSGPKTLVDEEAFKRLGVLRQSLGSYSTDRSRLQRAVAGLQAHQETLRNGHGSEQAATFAETEESPLRTIL